MNRRSIVIIFLLFIFSKINAQTTYPFPYESELIVILESVNHGSYDAFAGVAINPEHESDWDWSVSNQGGQIWPEVTIHQEQYNFGETPGHFQLYAIIEDQSGNTLIVDEIIQSMYEEGSGYTKAHGEWHTEVHDFVEISYMWKPKAPMAFKITPDLTNNSTFCRNQTFQIEIIQNPDYEDWWPGTYYIERYVDNSLSKTIVANPPNGTNDIPPNGIVKYKVYFSYAEPGSKATTLPFEIKPTPAVSNITTKRACSTTSDGELSFTLGALPEGYDHYRLDYVKDGSNYGSEDNLEPEEQHSFGLSNGAYTFHISLKPDGCSTGFNKMIGISEAINLEGSSTINPDCNEGTGSIIVETNNPYLRGDLIFSIAPQSRTKNKKGKPKSRADIISHEFEDLQVGNYSITIYDSECQTVNFVEINKDITPKNNIIINNQDFSEKICYNTDNGYIHISAVNTGSNSNDNIKYELYDSQNFKKIEEGLFADFDNLKADNYRVEVKSTEDQCTSIHSFTIYQPSNSLNINSSITHDITCHNGSDGIIKVAFNGGWSTNYELMLEKYNGTNWEVKVPFAEQTSPYYFNNLSHGDYRVSVKDDMGCIVTDNIELNNPAAFPDFSVEILNQPACRGDQGEIFHSPDNLTYEICDGNDNIIADGNTYYQLPSGSYYSRIKDAKGCYSEKSVSFEINEPEDISISIEINSTSCPTSTDGEVTINAANGTPEYNYSLFKKQNDTPYGNSNNHGSFINIHGDNYYVKVNDANNCTKRKDFSTLPLLAENFSLQEYQPKCHNDKGSFSVSYFCEAFQPNNGISLSPYNGNQSEYSYNSFNLGNRTITEVSYSHEKLSPGTYSLTISDECNQKLNYEFVINNPIPSPPTIPLENITKSNVLCNGQSNGQFSFSAIGGEGTLWFKLDKIQTNYQTSKTFTGLSAQTYDIIAKYIYNGKTCIEQFENIITITEPDILNVYLTPNTPYVDNYHILCDDRQGSLIAIPSGGTPTSIYTFNWSIPLEDDRETNENTINNLTTGGNYSVKVVDKNGCESDNDPVINLNKPVEIIATVEPDEIPPTSFHITCDTPGSIDVTLNNRNPDEIDTYVWDAPQTIDNVQNPSGLTVAGNYKLTITDIYGCFHSYEKLLEKAPEIQITGITPTNVTGCHDNTNGKLSVTVDESSNGPLNYTLIDSEGIETPQDIPLFDNLAEGTYTITVEDTETGCTASDVATISAPEELIISLVDEPEEIKCYGDATGVVKLSATGGVGQITFKNISTGATSADGIFSGLSAGVYTFNAFHSGDCYSNYLDVTITQPPRLSIIEPLDTTNVTSSCANDGTITCTASGGTGIYSFSINGAWQAVEGSEKVFTNLSTSAYIISVKDDNNCESTPSNIEITGSQSVSAVRETDSECAGADNGKIKIITDPLEPVRDYEVYRDNQSLGTNLESITNLAAGSYSIKVVEDTGDNCELFNREIEIVNKTVLNITYNELAPLCYNANGSLDVSVTPPSSFLYTFSLKENNVTIEEERVVKSNTFENLLVPGKNYSVTVLSKENCIASSEIISVTAPPEISFTATPTAPDCHNGKGSITISDVQNTTSGYSIELSGGVPTSTIVQNQNNLVFSGLSPVDNYRVKIIDDNNCVSSPKTKTIPNPLELTFNVVPTDATCSGFADGAIAINDVENGDANFTYSITNESDNTISENIADNSHVFSDLSAGEYSLSVVDADGCDNTASATVGDRDEIEITPIDDILLATAGGTVDVTVEASGDASQTLYYSLSGQGEAQTSAEFTGLNSGIYTLTVTYDGSCPVTEVFEVLEPDQIVLNNISDISLDCHGELATITLSASGGSGTLEYSIDGTNFSESAIFTDLPAGIYTFQVRDDAEQIKTSNQVTISEPDELLFNPPTINDVNCYGEATGSIQITATGGNGDYNYTFGGATTSGNPNTTGLFEGLSANTYNISVEDSKGCTYNEDVTLGQPGAALSFTVNTSNENCQGDNDGSIEINATGGTTGYSYFLDGASVGAIVNNLTAADYQVEVIDAKSCSTSQEVTISTTSPIIDIVSNEQTDVACFGDESGIISLSASCSGCTFDYNLTGGTTTSLNPNQTGLFEGLSQGNYTITVSNQHGCSKSIDYTITQPASAISITEPVAVTDVNCHNGSDGTLSIIANGGTGSLTYTVSDGNGFIKNQDNGNFSDLQAATYNITVTDENVCSEQTIATISQPAQVLTVNIVSLSDYNGVNVNKCLGNGINGSITVECEGGTADYKFSKNGSDYTNLISGQHTYSELSAGDYTIRAKDQNGCEAETNVITLTQDETTLSLAFSDIQPSDCDMPTGSARAVASNGILPYTYLWNPSDKTSALAENLAAGIYEVIITDANGCTSSDKVSISSKNPPEVSIEKQANVNCNGGSDGWATLSITATTSYTVTWTNTSQTGKTISNLSAGIYNATVLDDNNCQNNSVEVEITEPTAIDVPNSSATDILCFGENTGSIELAASGGTTIGGIYTYNLSPGAQQIIATDAQFPNLSAGNYTVTISDHSGCSINKDFILTQPAMQLSFTTAITTIGCYGGNEGAITLLPSGGTPPYLYSIGGSYTSDDEYTGLTAGNYTVSVKDAQNCVKSDTKTVLQPSSGINIISEEVTDATSPGGKGSVEVQANGGTAPILYSIDATNFSPDGLFEDLSAGNYTVTIKDANNCTLQKNYTVSEPNMFTIQLDKTNVSCNGWDNGQVVVTANGGIGPFEYAKNNGTFSSVTTYSGLAPGIYTFSVRDNGQSGYTKHETIEITEPNPIQINSVTDNAISCYNANDGSITISASGGSELEYSIDGSYQLSNSFTGVLPGTYTIKVRESAEPTCNKTYNPDIVFTNPDELVINSANPQETSCYNGSDGQIVVSATGGTGALLYSANDIDYHSNNTISGLTAKSYTVYVKDANECTASQAGVAIGQPDELIVTVESTSPPSYNGATDGEIILSAQGGTTPYNFSILNPESYQSSGTFSGLSEGTYNPKVKDAHNCIDTESEINLSGPGGITILSVNSTDALCYGADGTITISAAYSGTLEYSVNNGTSFEIYSTFNRPAGTYNIVVRDSSQHSVSTSWPTPVLISSPTEITINATSTPATSFGGDDGTITASASNGTPSYQYMLVGETSYQASGFFGNLTAGTYTIRVKDNNNCTKDKIINVTQPSNLTIDNVTTTMVTCNGGFDGTLTIFASGSSGVFQYSVDGGTFVNSNHFTNLSAGLHSIVVRDKNNTSVEASTNKSIDQYPAIVYDSETHENVSVNGASDGEITITAHGGNNNLRYSIDGTVFQPSNHFGNLGPDTYVIRIAHTANLSCITNSPPITITQPAEIKIVSITPKAVTCSGGSNGEITIIATGGNGLEYSIDDGDNYQGSNHFTGLSADTYKVKVRDAVVNSLVIDGGDIIVSEPDPISVEPAQVNDVTCYGGDNGAITITASGGNNLEYWFDSENKGSQNTFAGLKSDYYEIIVKEQNDPNCFVDLDSVFVDQPPELVVNQPGKTDVTCYNASNGTITVTASGGSGSYQYAIDGTYEDFNNFTDLDEGTYYVQIRDAADSNCEKSWGNVTINQPDEILINGITKTNVTCNGADNGTISITASGGNALEYSIGGVYQSSGSFTALSPSNYSVIVRDVFDNSCLKTGSIEVIEPETIEIQSVDVTDVLCRNFETGSLTINAIGGYNLEYSIYGGSNYQNSNHFTDLDATTYDIYVKDRDDDDCFTTTTATINEPATSVGVIADNPFTKSDYHGVNVTQCREDDGWFEINSTGGTGNHQYKYSFESTQTPYQSSNRFENLLAGYYTITIKDENECTFTTNLTLIDPSDMNYSVTKNNTACGQNNGDATLSVSGGVAPYTYLWDDPLNQTTETAAQLAAGSYNVSVRDANDCFLYVPVAISNSGAAQVEEGTITPATCSYLNDATAEITIVNGTSPFQIQWNDPSQSTTQQITDLYGGVYIAEITDANNCITAIEVDVPAPDYLEVSALDYEKPLCYGDANGLITVEAQGGTPLSGKYTFHLNNATTVFDISGTFPGLTIGNYDVHVTDNHGCISETESITVEQPPLLEIENFSHEIPLCYAGNDGSIFVDATGGTPTDSRYYYIISENGNIIDEQKKATALFENLSTGTYHIEVYDNNNCLVQKEQFVSQPTDIVIDEFEITEPLCSGSVDGSVFIDVSGGTTSGEYNYKLLKDNQLIAEIDNISAGFENINSGDYTIQARDNHNCLEETSFFVDEPTKIVVENITKTKPLCFEGDDGKIEISVSGGTSSNGKYIYRIYQNNRLKETQTNSTALFGNLSVGNYKISISDDHQCIIDTVVYLPQPPQFKFTTLLSEDITTCFGDKKGSITVATTGGTGKALYSIDKGKTYVDNNGQFENLAAGYYQVYAMDEHSCIVRCYRFHIKQPPQIQADTEITDVNCNGVDNGKIKINASGGTGNLFYSIDKATFIEGNVFNNLPPGLYPISVKDENNCLIEKELVSITEPSEIIIHSIESENVTCHNAKNGSITVSASGGTGSLEYSVNAGADFNSAEKTSELGSGTYFIKVRDSLHQNCISNAGVITITEPSPINLIDVLQKNVSCYDKQNGEISIIASGGTTLEYSINNGKTYQSDYLFTNLDTGIYRPIIRQTDDIECTKNSGSIIITEPSEITIESVNTQHVSCHNGQNGSILIEAVGGDELQYSIDGGQTYRNISEFDGLLKGTYIVQVAEKNDDECVNLYGTVDIQEPDSIVIQSVVTEDVSYKGGTDGSVLINATGGSGNLQYSIDNAGTYQSEPLFENLKAGTYTLQVRDSLDMYCITQGDIIIISEPEHITVQSIPVEHVTCFGSSNGSITILAEGGSNNFEYSINGGADYAAGNEFTNLSAGTYHIKIKDADAPAYIKDAGTIEISEPQPIEISDITVTNADCYGVHNGSITISANGGKWLEYSIDGENFYTNNTFTGLGAGKYAFVVKDKYDELCKIMSDSVVITQLAEISLVSSAQTNVTCHNNNNGAIQLYAEGGSGVYEYSIDGGASYHQSNDFQNLHSKTYQISIRDKNNRACAVNNGSVFISQPEPIDIFSIESTNVMYNGGNNGTISIFAQGGTKLRYSINGGLHYQDSNYFGDLEAGTYWISVHDSADEQCVAIGETVIITQPDQLRINSFTKTDIQCKGETNGSITVFATGGSILEYSINNGNDYQTDNTFTGLSAGDYTVLVRDGDSPDTGTEQIVITINEPEKAVGLSAENPIIKSDYHGVNVTQCNENDGWITINSIGGTGEHKYQYHVNNTISEFQSSNTLNMLRAGYYTITIEDANGCTYITSTELTSPTDMSYEISNIGAATCGENNGFAEIAVNGGVAPYSYHWNGIDNPDSPFAENLSSGIYHISVYDANQCYITADVGITDEASAEVSIVNINPVSCFGGTDGSLEIDITNGNAPYSIQWNNPALPQSMQLTDIEAGRYIAQITDANNCRTTKTVTVPTPPELQISDVVINEPRCFGDNNGLLSVAAMGGNGQYTFFLNDIPAVGNNTEYSHISAGNYPLYVKDQNECVSDTIPVTVNEPDKLSLEYIEITEPLAFGASDGSIIAQADGGTSEIGNYQYKLFKNTIPVETIDTDKIEFENITAGQYKILVKDEHNCSIDTTFNVNEPTAIEMSECIITNPDGNGQNNGSVLIHLTGGNPDDSGYTFTLIAEDSTTTELTGEYALFNHLQAGNYTLKVTDDGIYYSNFSISLTEPELLSFDNIAITEPACYGSNNGMISAKASGGVSYSGKYRYTLKQGTKVICNLDDNSVVFTGLKSGNYKLVATDKNGYTVDRNITIEQPDELLLGAIDITEALCYNDSSASVSYKAYGGTPFTDKYSFAIFKNGSIIYEKTDTTANISTIQAGEYKITATDAHGCVIEEQIIISEPELLAISSLHTENPVCNGENNGKINISVNGGTPKADGYDFILSGNGQILNGTNVEFTNLDTGSYSITIKDANLCTLKKNVLIDEPDLLQIEHLQSVSPQCSGMSYGEISVHASGGDISQTGLYTYQLVKDGDIVETSATLSARFTGLYPDSYSIKALDNNGCMIIDTVTIFEPEPISIESVDINKPLCKGDNNAKVFIKAQGGTTSGNYYYELKRDDKIVAVKYAPVANFESSFNLSAGEYNLTIKDENICSINETITIPEPEQLKVEHYNVGNPVCFGQSGKIQIQADGGTSYSGDYNYVIKSKSDTICASSAVFRNLFKGSYKIEIRDDNNCLVEQDFVISEPDKVKITGFSAQKPDCFNGNDGSITLSAIGGTSTDGMYSFLLYPDNIMQTGEMVTFNDLKASTYTIYAMDGNDCDAAKTITIKQPEPISTDSSFVLDLLCHNSNSGRISLKAKGGTSTFGDYTYKLYSQSKTWQTIHGSIADFQNLNAGEYSVEVLDENNCLHNETFLINEPAPLRIHSVIKQQPECWGGKGKILFKADGGTINDDYSFRLDSNLQTPVSIGEYYVFEEIKAGRYNVKIEDDNHCSFVRNIELSQPEKMRFNSFEVTDPTTEFTEDGSIHLNIAGGSPSNNTYSLTLSKNNYDYRIVQKSEHTFNNLEEAMYNIEAKDIHECSIDSIVSLEGPEPFTVNFETRPAICKHTSTGKITATVDGGTPPYRFKWYKNGYNVGTGATLQNCSAGEYIVEVWDANNGPYGLHYQGMTKYVSISEPEDFLKLNIAEQQNVLKHGDSTGVVAIQGSGGWGNYTYSFDNISFTHDTLYSNLVAGNYNYYVKDNHGCIRSANVKITEPEPLHVYASWKKDVGCKEGSDGIIQVYAIGGISPYSYSLNNEDFYPMNVFYNLPAGTHWITARDRVGVTEQLEIELDEPATFVSAEVTNVEESRCGIPSGKATVIASGGSGNYSYKWNDPENQISSTAICLEGAKTYQVTVKDGNDCSASISVNIPKIQGPYIADSIFIEPLCKGDINGSIEIDVTGGIRPYEITWDNAENQSGNIAGNLSAGQYSVTIKDIDDCITKDTLTLNQPDKLFASVIGQRDPVCFGYNDGYIIATGDGGTAPYEFEVTDINSNQQIQANQLPAGEYIVEVTDANNCKDFTDEVHLENPQKLEIGLEDSISICGGQEYELDAGLFETYHWTSDSGYTYDNRVAYLSKAGWYYLSVTDEKGCHAADSIKLIRTDNLLDAVFLMPSEAYVGDTIVLIEVSWPMPDYVNWNIPEELQFISGENPKLLKATREGDYTVSLNAHLGLCSDVLYKDISIFPVDDDDDEKRKDKVEESIINEIVLYPNPNNGHFLVEVKLNQESDIELLIYNVLSESPIKRKIGMGETDYYVFDFNIENSISGLYLLVVKSGNETKTVKFMKN